MTDLSTTIEAKSSQMNADDLLAGPKTIKITKVSAKPSSAEQPIAISYEGDNGKPFYPCKTSRRLLVTLWSADGSSYVGRSLTLYRDPDVTWGGVRVGGLRISHASHIEKSITVALTASKNNKKPVTVHPLVVKETPRQDTKPADRYDAYGREFARRLKEEPWQAVDSWFSNTEADREGMAPERVQNMKNALAEKIEEGGE
jgi:hypothetical protein